MADAVGARLGLVTAWARVSELETSWNGLVETAIAGQEDERRRVAGELHGAG